MEEILLKSMFDVCDYEGKGYVDLDIVSALADSLRQFFFRKADMHRNSNSLISYKSVPEKIIQICLNFATYRLESYDFP